MALNAILFHSNALKEHETIIWSFMRNTIGVLSTQHLKQYG
jgi:hypothetical protein